MRESIIVPFLLFCPPVSQQICPQNRAKLPKISLFFKCHKNAVVKKMKGESPLLSSHQNKKTSEIQHQRLSRLNIRRTDLLFIRKRHKISLRKTKVRDERFIYHIYIPSSLSLSLSLCVCVSLSRSRTRIHRVFFIPSFYSLLFPMMMCFGLFVLFYKAMMVFILFSFQKG